MPDIFGQTSSLTVFLGIAGVGFLFLVLTLVFGEIFEHFDGHDGDTDGGDGPSFFSPRVLAVFTTAFGATGAICIQYGFGTAASSVAGFLSGGFFGTLIYWFAKFLFGQQATTSVGNQDMVGRTGRVVVAIPAGGVGQVRLQLGEEIVDKIAKANSGEGIASNTPVTVESVLGEVVVVRPA
ncbi:MAG: NfeD family protein [Bryobacteraceae bacterium]